MKLQQLYIKLSISLRSVILAGAMLFGDAEGFTQTDSAAVLKSGIEKYHQGNFEGAAIDLAKARDYFPSNPDVYFYLGEVALMSNENKKAMEYFNKAIELSPKTARYYKGRGKLKARFEDYRGSIEDFTRAVELDKNFSDAFFNRGLSYLMLKEYKSAIADFSEVIRINPKDFQAWAQRGTAKLQGGDQKGACSDWSKAGELGYEKIYDSIKKHCNK